MVGKGVGGVGVCDGCARLAQPSLTPPARPPACPTHRSTPSLPLHAGASLRYAQLLNVVAHGAVFYGADLRGAVVSGIGWDAAYSDHYTTCPDSSVGPCRFV